MIPIVFLFYKNTTTFKDYPSYEKVHGKWIRNEIKKKEMEIN